MTFQLRDYNIFLVSYCSTMAKKKGEKQSLNM